MRTVFLGTSDISVPSLEALIESEHEVCAVITQPDKAKGRGRKMAASPVKEAALRENIPLIQPAKVGSEEVLEELRKISPDIFVLVSFAQMIPEALCSIAPFGCINMHPSLLPKYRGAGPIRGPILNGDKEGGVTIMQIAPKMDSGDILLQEKIPLDPKETLKTYEAKAAKAGAQLVLKALKGLEEGTIVFTPQNEEEATYLKKIDKSDGLIDFNRPAAEIERQIRACDPWPSAFTYLNGKMFKIWDADVEEKESSALAGTVAEAGKKYILIKTSQGLLKPNIVQIEGKRRMTMEEFLRGYKIKEGDRFGKQD